MAKSKEKAKEVVEIDKEEINDYIDKQVKKYYSEEIEKANKRIIRYKNRKILFRNIVILVLIVVVLYLLHILYTLNYFGNIQISSKSNNKNTKTVEKKVEEKELSLDDLKRKYSSYLDNIKISENCDYIKDYYDGKLTEQLKLYLVLNNLNLKKITTEENYNIIEEDLIKNEYNKLFDNEYKPSSFKYNGREVRYISKMKSYITDELLEKEETNIVREITNIEVLKDEVSITVIEGVVKDNTLYNNDEEIDDYNEETKLTDYEEDLNKITYVFRDKKLMEIK